MGQEGIPYSIILFFFVLILAVMSFIGLLLTMVLTT